MLKKLIKPFILPILLPILDMNYRIKKRLYFKSKMKYILTTLKEQNITDINKFNENNWHHGYCYFTGIYKDKKVFIKVDTKLKMLKNEELFYEIMKDKIYDYLIPLEFFFENKKLQLVCYQFLSNYTELDEKKLFHNISYLDDIYHILNIMKEKEVIHRDIKLDNFMVHNNDIKIIDFTFSNSLKVESNFKELDISIKENILILKGLGIGLNPKDFHWNDSISIIKILKINYLENYNTYIKRFEELSYNNTYILDLKTELENNTINEDDKN